MLEYFYLIFGFMFALRILKLQSRKVFLQKTAVTIIGTCIFSWFFLSVWIHYDNASTSLVLALAPAFIVFISFEFHRFVYVKRLNDEIIRYVDICYLELNMGHSFRHSMMLAKTNVSSKYQKLFDIFIENVSFSQHNSIDFYAFPNSFNDFISNFIRIFNHKGSQIVAIKSYLECLKTKRLIRHKSGQLSFQARLQAIILGIFYAVCFMYMLHFHYSEDLKIVFSVSLILFSMGQFLIWRSGGAYKWKV